tara:strand:- start:230 stop:466 length:237 start_codon:yes stop_codon:yes gene_type:complete
MTQTNRWIDRAGQPLSCKDKLATLDANFEEVLEVALEALEDAAVMGADVDATRRAFMQGIDALQPRFADKADSEGGES